MPGRRIPYWMDGAADVAETTYTPFQAEPDAAPVRLIVRRVKPAPGSQLALFATYSYHGFITDRDGETLELEADHRRHAEIENAHTRPQVRRGAEPISPRAASPPTAAWLAVQVMAHNLARWTARVGLGQQIVTTKTLRRWVFALAGRITRSARRLTPASSPALALGGAVQPRPGPTASHSTPSLNGARPATDPPANPTSPQTRASPVRERLLPCPIPPSRSPQPL